MTLQLENISLCTYLLFLMDLHVDIVIAFLLSPVLAEVMGGVANSIRVINMLVLN